MTQLLEGPYPYTIEPASALMKSHPDARTDLPATESPAVLIKNRHSVHNPDISAWKLAMPPQRPPRNPARDMPPKKAIRPNTATGTRADITPWELFPVPDYTTTKNHHRNASRLSLSSDFGIGRRKSTGSKPPSKPTVAPSSPASPKKSVSIPHPVSMAFGFDGGFGYVPPPRKSPKSTTKPAKKKKSPTTPTSLSAPSTSLLPDSPKPTVPRTPPSAIPTPPSVIEVPSPDRDQASDRDQDTLEEMKFSTADRTILEELKRSITAKASQFVYKNRSSALVDYSECLGWGAHGIGAGKKHHPYPAAEVPYPRNYEKEALDLDVWETAFCAQISGSITWHVFDRPPAKVLDIGCGPGTWVMNCARTWKDCSFVGLDIVPLHPDLTRVGSIDLASRITWVQANFLEGLPFPNEEFDFVHVKRIALGVPEDKWDALFEEIVRVMKPGAAFELLEEDLFFPGKLIENDDSTEPAHEPVGSKHQHHIDREHQDDHEHDSDSLLTSSGGSHRNSLTHGPFSDEATTSSSTGHTSIDDSPTSEFRTAPLGREPIKVSYILGKDVDPPVLSTGPSTRQLNRPRSSSDARRSLWINTRGTGGTMTLARSPSAVNLRPSQSLSNATPPLQPKRSVPTYSSSGFHLPTRVKAPAPSPYLSFDASDSQSSFDLGDSGSPQQGSHTPFVLRSLPRPPDNPQDHTLLEHIYTEMCASRFINLSPLSLIPNVMALHFDRVRTHPPLQFTFPPLPKPTPVQARHQEDPDEEAKDAIIPSPLRTPILSPSPTVRTPNTVASTPILTPKSTVSTLGDYFGNVQSEEEEKRFLSMRGLLKNSSRYVTLDGARNSGYAPSAKTSLVLPHLANDFTVAEGLPAVNTPLDVLTSNRRLSLADSRVLAVSARSAGLPNTTLRMDLRTLNLHLALRVSEIVACSESMWEWVAGQQKEARLVKAEEGARRRARSGSGVDTLTQQRRPSVSTVNEEKDATRSAILELTRDDFNALLSNFEMDMRDQMCLGHALEDRFSWMPPGPSSPPYEKKQFNNARLQWQQWQSDHPTPTGQPRRPTVSSLSSTLPETSPTRPRNPEPSDPTPRGENIKPPVSLPPTGKLSRAFRVLVAWKAQ